ncbi:MAG: hypothetical protein HOQ05_13330 [Corynebacteriales bacterium]|nr:hypothetical protein [Mycobacteriales bacterium]
MAPHKEQPAEVSALIDELTVLRSASPAHFRSLIFTATVTPSRAPRYLTQALASPQLIDAWVDALVSLQGGQQLSIMRRQIRAGRQLAPQPDDYAHLRLIESKLQQAIHQQDRKDTPGSTKLDDPAARRARGLLIQAHREEYENLLREALAAIQPDFGSIGDQPPAIDAPAWAHEHGLFPDLPITSRVQQLAQLPDDDFVDVVHGDIDLDPLEPALQHPLLVKRWRWALEEIVREFSVDLDTNLESQLAILDINLDLCELSEDEALNRIDDVSFLTDVRKRLFQQVAHARTLFSQVHLRTSSLRAAGRHSAFQSLVIRHRAQYEKLLNLPDGDQPIVDLTQSAPDQPQKRPALWGGLAIREVSFALPIVRTGLPLVELSLRIGGTHADFFQDLAPGIAAIQPDSDVEQTGSLFAELTNTPAQGLNAYLTTLGKDQQTALRAALAEQNGSAVSSQVVKRLDNVDLDLGTAAGYLPSILTILRTVAEQTNATEAILNMSSNPASAVAHWQIVRQLAAHGAACGEIVAAEFAANNPTADNPFTEAIGQLAHFQQLANRVCVQGASWEKDNRRGPIAATAARAQIRQAATGIHIENALVRRINLELAPRKLHILVAPDFYSNPPTQPASRNDERIGSQPAPVELYIPRIEGDEHVAGSGLRLPFDETLPSFTAATIAGLNRLERGWIIHDDAVPGNQRLASSYAASAAKELRSGTWSSALKELRTMQIVATREASEACSPETVARQLIRDVKKATAAPRVENAGHRRGFAAVQATVLKILTKKYIAELTNDEQNLVAITGLGDLLIEVAAQTSEGLRTIARAPETGEKQQSAALAVVSALDALGMWAEAFRDHPTHGHQYLPQLAKALESTGRTLVNQATQRGLWDTLFVASENTQSLTPGVIVPIHSTTPRTPIRNQ